jgi:hypothetical protein
MKLLGKRFPQPSITSFPLRLNILLTNLFLTSSILPLYQASHPFRKRNRSKEIFLQKWKQYGNCKSSDNTSNISHANFLSYSLYEPARSWLKSKRRTGTTICWILKPVLTLYKLVSKHFNNTPIWSLRWNTVSQVFMQKSNFKHRHVLGDCVTYKTGFEFGDRLYWNFIQLVTFHISLSSTEHSRLLTTLH